MPTVIVILFIAILAITAPAAPPQEHPEPPARPQSPFPFAIPRAALKTNQQSAYLSIILDMKPREAEALADDMLKVTYLDVFPWYLVNAGEHRAADAMEPRFRAAINYPKEPRTDAAPFKDVRPVPAVPAILDAAKDRRIIMFNEEHRSSIQRAFLNQLIDGLAEAGFTHLALEAVNSNAVEAINARGYPVISSGLYTLDPAYGDLIRRARARGLTILAYDYDHPAIPPLAPDDFNDPERRENHREANAARHLQDLLETDPKSRLIVFAGRGHIYEKPAGSWTPMSTRVKEATGIDPLTINLNSMVECDDRSYELNAYHHASEQNLVADTPIILVAENGEFWSHDPGGYDATVFHPRTRLEDGRPHYLKMGTLRKPIHIDIDRNKVPGPALLQAHLKGESPDAIPIDHTILWPDQPTPPLFLRPGHYTIQVIDRENNHLHQQRLEID